MLRKKIALVIINEFEEGYRTAAAREKKHEEGLGMWQITDEKNGLVPLRTTAIHNINILFE